MKKLCKRIITFSLVLCMALSVFTGVVYATTMDIYVDVTQELKQKEFEGLDSCFGQ